MRFVAIVKFVKCFVGGSARIQLDEKVVFQNKIGALRVFNYFKDLRNKHFVHHKNSYTQSVPTATLNNGRKDFKIERIVAISAVGITLDQANYANLLLAATDSLDWVRAKFDALCIALSTELEKQPYESLMAMPEISVKPPDIAEMINGEARSDCVGGMPDDLYPSEITCDADQRVGWLVLLFGRAASCARSACHAS